MPRELEINSNVVEMEYAVRGPIPQRAAALRAEGRKTIPCNIGNPQALGQSPITYYRQVLSLLEEPERIERDRTLRRLYDATPSAFEGIGPGAFSSPYVLEAASRILAGLETGLGAYTDSKGPLFVRQAVARYIDARDSRAEEPAVPADPESIFLTNGASEGAKHVIDMLIASDSDGIMIPIPQYPLYSAAIRRCGGVQVSYYPDEEDGWTLSRPILEKAYDEAVGRGVRVKGIVVINPGNPTGAILDEKSVSEVIDFADERGLVIIADEVYQHNLYGAEFVSFARVLGRRDVPLVSLHSTSKGFYGECGHRGGYLELRNDPRLTGTSLTFADVLVKQASVSLCSNTVGQALTYLVVSPPEEGSEPYERFVRERDQILSDLHAKATMIRAAFEQMEGVECFGRIGAMYLFPRLGKMPAGKTDFDYCMALLEQTGLTTVNGSGFGQAPGTHHLRIAFLPPKELLEEVLPKWTEFHNSFVG